MVVGIDVILLLLVCGQNHLSTALQPTKLEGVWMGSYLSVPA